MSDHPLKSVADAGASVAAGVENAVSSVVDSGADVAQYAGRHARTVGTGVEGFIRHNPFASVGSALALGVLAGVMARRSIFD